MFTGLSENILFLLFLIILIGNYLGSFKWKGVSLGPSAIFLTAVVAGNFGVTMPRIILELGLSLFVYAVGFQVGPKFIRDFRRGGLQMVGMAFSMIFCTVVATVCIAVARDLPVDLAAGLFAGSVTNTPSLAAAIELIEKYKWGSGGVVTASYGITYLFGVVGVVVFVQLLPRALQRNVLKEEETWSDEQKRIYPALNFRQFRVENSVCFGVSIEYLNQNYMHKNDPINVSRVLRKEKDPKNPRKTILVEHVARMEFTLQKDDIVTVVGKDDCLGPLKLVFGREVPASFLNTDVVSCDTVVTAPAFGNKRIGDLEISRHRVIIARVIRSDDEISPNEDTVIELGDTVRFVGHRKETQEFAKLIGAKNSHMEETSLFTFILGLVVGLLLGAISVPVIGGSPLSLGPAGGALIAGLLISNRRRIGKKEIHVPVAALKIMQDLGLMLFMAGAGLIAGGRFMGVFSQYGAELILEGAIITLATLFSGVLYMRFTGANILAMMAGIAAGMTQPSALEVTKERAKTELPLLAYASVYPFAMVFKIVFIQVLVLVLHFISLAGTP